MSRRYGHTISVEQAQRSPGEVGHAQASTPSGPRQFVWHSTSYRIAELLATWHLRDRWWQPGPIRQSEQREYPPDGAAPSGAPGWDDHPYRADVVPQIEVHCANHESSSDRYYYRVRCVSGLVCELYYDAISGQWVLDRVYD